MLNVSIDSCSLCEWHRLNAFILDLLIIVFSARCLRAILQQLAEQVLYAIRKILNCIALRWSHLTLAWWLPMEHVD